MHESELVILDWSGVVSDDRIPVYLACMQMCDYYGIPRMSQADWLLSTAGSAGVWFKARGVADEEAAINQFYTETFATVLATGNRPTMYPDAPFFLNYATSRRPAIVVSSHPHIFLEAEATHYNIDSFFRRLYGDSINKTATIQQALSEMGVNPRSCVMIGDTTSDIHFAKAAGVRTVGIATGYHTREQLEAAAPDVVVASLTELAEYF